MARADRPGFGRTALALAQKVRRSGDVLGIVCAMRPTRKAFSAADEAFLRDVSNMVAVVLSGAHQAAQLRLREHWLRTILEQVPCGVTVLDETGRPVMTNELGERLIGRQLDPRVPVADQFSEYERQAPPGGSDVASSEAIVAGVLTGKTVQSQYFTLRRPDTGDQVWTSVSARPLRDASGAIVGAVIVFEDVTRELQLHRERELLRDDNFYLRGALDERERRLEQFMTELAPTGERIRAGETLSSASSAGLTERERDVLRSLANGRSNAQIAAEIHLSIGTVKQHVKRILAKLEVGSRTHAAVRALELGLARSARESPARRAPGDLVRR